MSAPSGPDRATSRVVGANVRAAHSPNGKRATTLLALAARTAKLGTPLAASAISDIENGKRAVTVDQLTVLATALDVPPTDLLTPKGEPNDRVRLSGIGEKSHAEMVAWVNGDTTGPNGYAKSDLGNLELGPYTTLHVIAKRLRGQQRG